MHEIGIRIILNLIPTISLIDGVIHASLKGQRQSQGPTVEVTELVRWEQTS